MDTTRILNWGLLSTARINQSLIPPLRLSKRNKLVGVASRSQEKAKEYAHEWKIPQAYGSYEEMLKDPQIDVIYNPLPNDMHAEWTIKACNAGKHVLCEKPLAVSLKEVDDMAKAAAANKVVLAEAFMYRHHPQTIKVKELVDSGAIGTLAYIYGNFSFNLSNPEDIRLSNKPGGGSVWDIGCYPLSYARYITGNEPEEIFTWMTNGPTGVDDFLVSQLRFPNGVFCQINTSFRLSYRKQIEIAGSKGRIVVNEPFKPNYKGQILLEHDNKVEKISTSKQELYIGEVEDIADAVLLNKPPRVSLAYSRGNVASMLAFLESAKKGKPVTL